MPDIASADAPGRVNLIGEHTDYHQGFVLPSIIPQRTRVHLVRRDDRQVRAFSASVAPHAETYPIGAERPGRGWLDYVQGVTVVLRNRGADVPGFDLRIDSDVPVGAGVSSSAALTVSLIRALRLLIPFAIDDVELARLAQTAEADFVGAPVGMMDQMASSLGRLGEVLLIDTRTLETTRIPLPVSVEIVVIDSGVPHRHAGGGYVSRRRESFEAAARLGVAYLRDLSRTDLARFDALPPILARRARHVITENERVQMAATAMREGDLTRLGDLFAQSHASMRTDYEITTPEIDALVGIARRRPAIYGARMTGGGFGGAIVLLARAGAGRAAAQDICDEYGQQHERRATVIVPASR